MIHTCALFHFSGSVKPWERNPLSSVWLQPFLDLLHAVHDVNLTQEVIYSAAAPLDAHSQYKTTAPKMLDLKLRFGSTSSVQ
eukprot:CAMPEP_0197314540 /NCGR_PEP_ID=MMETSP0891-20130614/34545_1 /TAXON_ID=44058 ORGANISM="Aureoumbra lagunensis, Strain CCMP1510" /NCGR_SAMPLE_ID=MMETSP0891 /ASSEMBLY_ACC=CAM_ASM_000534 /LENGTH=81 /DNA_ID=CAMNT_0042803043 /DNA_START=17 /DNA_END=259 /DNA_ORIENTATION=+